MATIQLKDIKSKPKPTAGNRSGWLDGLLSVLNKDISLFGQQMSDKKKERLYSELGILLSAGIDIKTALEIIVEQQKKQKDRALYEQILEVIIAGSSLSEAIEKTGKFSLYEFYSFQIAEESGQIVEVLTELTKFYAGKIKQKRQIISALTYPAIVMFTAVGAIFFMMRFMVPMFADIFKRFKTDLPPLTKMVINFSDALSTYFIYFFLLLVGLVIFIYSQKKQLWFRKYSSVVLLHIPIVKNILTKIYLARFSQAMSLLLGARNPLVNSIELVKNMINFYPIEHSLTIVQERILKGDSLYKSLSAFSFYDKRMISLIKVGEEVNKLDVIFQKLSKQYEDEVQSQTSILGTLIEPVLIIFLGLMVAVILIAMYLPLFKLSTSVGGA